MSDHLLERHENGVAWLTLNRPERLNALTDEMLDGLLAAMQRLSGDRETGCIVLSGAGRGFSAGGDVKGMAAGSHRDDTLEGRTQSLRSRMEVSRIVHEMPKPVIAMIRGPAAGASLSIALACDMRIASETALITTGFAQVALSGDFGGSWFLTRLVGPAKAKELYMTAARLGAEEALTLGIVNRVVPDDALEAETTALAERLAAGPRITLAYMKQTLNGAVTASLSETLDTEARNHSRSGLTEDHLEAAKAFVEKRKPVFSGR